ncbi:MAG: hypothetical protein ISQ09_06990 [Rubripirellula sp.]|nr:hypothetical protein [Rubripirellula sp.]
MLGGKRNGARPYVDCLIVAEAGTNKAGGIREIPDTNFATQAASKVGNLRNTAAADPEVTAGV